MALTKKGSRNITVDGVRYRWRVRRKPSYGQAMAESNLSVAVESADTPGGATLLIDAGEPRPDSWLAGPHAAAMLPADVARCVRTACAAGWDPERPGPTFTLLAPPPVSADEP